MKFGQINVNFTIKLNVCTSKICTAVLLKIQKQMTLLLLQNAELTSLNSRNWPNYAFVVNAVTAGP